MKKKVLTLALAVCMAASLAGCGSGSAEETTGNAEESEASGKTLVMATNAEFPPPMNFMKAEKS